MNPGRIKPYIDEAELHLRRAEHQVFVSLKYTRTGDVIINAINRIMEGLQEIIDGLLAIAIKEGKLEEMPESMINKLKKVKELYPEQIVEDGIKLYRFLNSFMKSKTYAENEYRKNVALIGVVNNQETYIDIEVITNYFMVAKEFLKYIKEKAKQYIEEEKEEDEQGIDIY